MWLGEVSWTVGTSNALLHLYYSVFVFKGKMNYHHTVYVSKPHDNANLDTGIFDMNNCDIMRLLCLRIFWNGAIDIKTFIYIKYSSNIFIFFNGRKVIEVKSFKYNMHEYM